MKVSYQHKTITMRATGESCGSICAKHSNDALTLTHLALHHIGFVAPDGGNKTAVCIGKRVRQEPARLTNDLGALRDRDVTTVHKHAARRHYPNKIVAAIADQGVTVYVKSISGVA
jgi:hypothetical protein